MDELFQNGLSFLKREEQITLMLRSLYEQRGYSKYKMTSFEEYDLYLDNKSFLRAKNIITFNDLDGRVLALKPDVTLSVVKNTRATERQTEKIYYLENVYWLDGKSRAYREIGQLGLECFGKLDAYQTGEVVELAAKTLSVISPDFILAISHTGFVLRLLEGLDIDLAAQKELLECIRQKRAHEIIAGAAQYGLTIAVAEILSKIVQLGGSFPDTIEKARSLAITKRMAEALNELDQVYARLSAAGYADTLRLDFSLVNDLDYYSGILFQGYVEGVPRPVLFGGYYGSLLKKFGRDLDAIGFAVYLNELAYLRSPTRDAGDALILYGDDADPLALSSCAESLMAQGYTVRVEREKPEDQPYKKVYRFAGDALTEVTQNA